MTIKDESSTLFGPSSDEELQVDYDSHTPSEGEVQEVQEVQRPRSRQSRRMDETRRAPNPFPERNAADVLATLHRPPDRESNIIKITSMRSKSE